jgi:Undecaprenyl-phosphate glucose phosphotransferase
MEDRYVAGSDSVFRLFAKDEIRRPDVSTVVYIAAITDAVLIVFCAVACYLMYSAIAEFEQATELSKYVGAGILLAASFVTLSAAKGAYRPMELMRVRKQMLHVVVYGAGSIGFVILLGFLMKIGGSFSRGTALMFTVLCPAMLVTTRLFWSQWIPKAAARGLVRPRRIMLVCRADYAISDLREQISGSGATLTNVLTFPQDQSAREWMSTINASIARGADEVLVACASSDLSTIGDLLAELRTMPMPVKLALDPTIAEIVRQPATRIGQLPVVEVQHAPLSRIERFFKRAFDIGFALCGLVCLSPIFIVTAIAIKLESRGPVFFIQRRRGCNDVTFGIVKFRSMTVLEDGETVVQATRNDARVTRVGALIRSTSIDEIPQLWNVLRGDMSLVGPRPHAVSHDDRYDALIARYAFRRNVKPGITGWAQINGFRGETPTIDSMEARVEHDLWYIHNWSLWLDLKIILMTMVALADSSKSY